MTEENKSKVKPDYNFAYGIPPTRRVDETPPVKIILFIILGFVVAASGAFFLGKGTTSNKFGETTAGHDKFKDMGKHDIHGGDCYIVKEFLSLDGQLHVEFEIKKKLELQFELIDSAGYTVWQSAIMTDAPGHHEVKWDPVHRNGTDLKPGNYSLAVETAGERLVIGNFLHGL
jgi:hypothetical protein